MNEDQEIIENTEVDVTPDSSGTITQTPGVTREDLQEFASQIGNQVAQAITPPVQQEQEEYVDPNNFESVEAFQRYIAQRDMSLEQRMEARLQERMAPLLIQQGTALITQNMDEFQKQAFNEQLAKIPAPMRANAVTDPVISEMLKNAAIGAALVKNGGKIPGTNDPSSRDSGNLTADDRTDIENIMKMANVSEKRAREIVAQTKKAVGI